MASNPNFKEPSYEEISARARTIWESRGRPEGQDDEIWLDAERELQRDAVVSNQEIATTRPARPSSGGANSRSPLGSTRRARRTDADEPTRTLANEIPGGNPMREPSADPDA